MTIYLIRHGATAANEQRLYCGSTDLPLSPAGRAALAGLSYDIKNARFLTSGRKRANETLALLFGDVNFCVEPRFCEMDFGSFEMKSYEQLRTDPLYQRWLTGDNEQNPTPGGESGAQMKRRALAAFFALREDSVVITHGGVIAAIMQELFPQEHKNRYDWQPAPGHGYRLESLPHWHYRAL